MDPFAFKRIYLAQAYCDSLAGKGISNASSGLFLAGPRRVGKTTFLLTDLIPEAQKRHWETVYIDLWANKTADPLSLIIEALKTSLKAYQNKLTRLSKKFKLQKINFLKIIELDFSTLGLPDNITLVDLLRDLIYLSEKPVLLIIDEAQHALSSANGINAMFSIKSARDQMNSIHKAPELMLVLTGSNRDKLAQLTIKKNQPFFGSEISAFPLLGEDYIHFFTEKINAGLAANNQFNEESVWEAFQLTGHRPEILRQIIGRTALNHHAESFSDLLKQDAFLWHSQLWEEFENDFSQLSSIQKSVLTLLIQKGPLWSPFSENSLQYYRINSGQSGLSISAVQAAIHSLRERGFIWQSSRGAYALEDESFSAWFRHTQTL